MVLVFDAAATPVRDRLEALNAVFLGTDLPQRVTTGHTALIRHRAELFDLGPGVQLMRNEGNGLTVIRGPEHIRMAAPERFAVGFQITGRAVLTTPDRQSVTGAGDIVLVDTTQPYTYVQEGRSRHKAFLADRDQLGLPVDLMSSAAPVLKASPLYPLVRAYFMKLCEVSDGVSTPAQVILGHATVELVRAFITTATDHPLQKDPVHRTLHLRIMMFIHAHLHERSLNAEGIAAAHNISLRQLYSLWARAEVPETLEAWVINRRLERARERLVNSDPELVTIASVAHECGFADATHFSRRFRDTYKMTPSEWRVHGR